MDLGFRVYLCGARDEGSHSARDHTNTKARQDVDLTVLGNLKSGFRV
jgi:hypothetical protein